ncbi:DUF1489 family protein [Novosphingobium terrae]|jgi:hypothetical protein|uniref:DUF1489 family protein n=1 Tax=Novosphingobium terrae TaxID=2726189 RepID=UPI001F13F7B9|nr:DUF1489 domain-containing protein [Novosphingobium terrae]
MADLPLNMTKIAFGCESAADLRARLEAQSPEARITTRYLPTRAKEMEGGSLFWIHAHMIVGRSPILGFEQKEDGRFWVRLSPELIPVAPMPRRAHQGWRYLAGKDAPADLGSGGDGSEALPGHLVSELAKLGLV